MKRRNAIKNLVFISGGIGLLPSCNWDLQSIPTYDNLLLDKDRWNFINTVSNTILPAPIANAPLEEMPTHFVLTSINDCFSPKEITKFLDGCAAFQSTYHEKYGKKSEQLKDFISQILFIEEEDEEKEKEEKKKRLTDPQFYFLDAIKGLRLRHFTSQENFLKNNLAFEFVPARFSGCVSV